MKPIGVLVFTGDRIIVGRADRKNYSFDGLKLNGLNKVLRESGLQYEYCSASTLNEYDHVVCSLTSFHDVLNLLLAVPIGKKPMIHIGGPACNNINPLLEIVDTANFGRCDNGKLAKIIAGDKLHGVWRKANDPEFFDTYYVDASGAEGLSADELSFGCSRKCAFCFYSHWNGFAARAPEAQYRSGKKMSGANREDFFSSLDWAAANQGATTALDGLSEKSRAMVRKPCSTKYIRQKLLQSNETAATKSLRVKIYCIGSYPWEDETALLSSDIPEAIESVADRLKNKMIVLLMISHFIPFQKTPMWHVPFNWTSVRDQAKSNPVLFSNGNVTMYSGATYTPSPSVAAQSTLIQRASKKDRPILMTLASRKWRRMKSGLQCAAMKSELKRFFTEQSVEAIPNVITPNAIKRIRKAN